MRLTKTIRDAFVRAAIADVPQTDYEELIRKAAMDDIVAQLSPKVREFWDDAALRDWIRMDWNCFHGVTIIHPSNDNRKMPTLTEKIGQQCLEWRRLAKEQEQSIRKLRENLSGAAESVTTRKALAELLPEFEKYLPASEAQANRNVPMIANLVADFSKAGWPKDANAAKVNAVA